ncbi:LSU ribosomal protein L3P [Magnetococcus marinus MC-1]|uniref:Large ribosomal subunit protein uL3 n=1 Tax=Magnetococcus marinus (strain ATCC BAA-1437 / JCM 17883 / MC-1) TaxID=156889 RepID=RL3_MAGMM|nr:50S ribosomal protein L3 [Magnetococcus marinus]A0L5X3.1 RecName: Full=Large ribosomal subunit protein uL3; AltName: Full=50S ribosomal protein L3 [Magnetococcus marinus MC-1]ABK43366.1 LSU ribosomal protein L3P [Magnetococcus marinus MC-1]
MRSGLIGRKLGMSQMFTEDGQRIPVTLVQLGPCAVVAKRSDEQDGYNAVQLGFEEAKPSRLSKTVRGQYAKANVTPRRVLREFRVSNPESYEVGQELTAEQFAVDSFVDVTGKTVGKGFAGVMKRWGFRGGRASHGAHKVHRSGGSIGQCQTPGRVYKNKKMAGHMGQQTRTVQNLKVAYVDAVQSIIAVKGSIPGSKGSLVLVRDALKKGSAE